MSTIQPRHQGYPIDRRLRDSRPVTTPLRTSVNCWLRRRLATN